MALARIKRGFYLTGLSTDTKPTEAIPLFSQYTEIDTGKVWLYVTTDSHTSYIWKEVKWA